HGPACRPSSPRPLGRLAKGAVHSREPKTRVGLRAHGRRSLMASSQFHARAGVLLEVQGRRPGAVEWRVRLGDGSEARAIAYLALGGDLSPGRSVWLNTTAAELALGTGGAHF